MVITQVTTWTGTPGGMELLEAAAKDSAPIHESLGAKNPRLMRGMGFNTAAITFSNLIQWRPTELFAMLSFNTNGGM